MLTSAHPSARLNCEQLEDRSVPTWFMVRMISPYAGYDGSTAATYASGGLETRPEYDIDQPGYAYVNTSSAGEAIREVVTGTVQMFVPFFGQVGYTERTFTFSQASAGFAASDHLPFLVQPGASLPLLPPPPPITPGASLWGIYLEDLSFDPAHCDWDYNDRSWVAEVLNLESEPTGPGSITGVVWDDMSVGPQNNMQEWTEARIANVAVSLYNADNGDLIRTTLTDVNGTYAFSNLVLGDYLIRINLGMLEHFVQKDYGGDFIDSDVGENGYSDMIHLGGSGPTSQTVDGGKAKSAAPDDNGSQYDILVAKRGGRSMASELKVAKWHEAFEVANGQPALTGVDASGYDFIDKDDDGFRVFIKDKTANNAATINANLSTINAGDYNDAAKSITLVKVTLVGWNDWYMSDSQLLVSNEIDDILSRAPTPIPGGGGKTGGGIRSDNEGTHATMVNQKDGYTIPLTDRTHRIALGGKVKVAYTPANGAVVPPAEVEAKVQRTIKLHINIMRNKPQAGGGTETVNPIDVNKDIDRIREIYAQIGIKVEIVGNPVISDPPTPAAGQLGILESPQDTPSIQSATVEEDDNIKLAYTIPSSEHNELFGLQNLRTPADANGKNDVEVYYVNAMSNREEGESFPKRSLKAAVQQFAHSVVIAKVHGYTTLAHEVGHVLEDLSNSYAGIVFEKKGGQAGSLFHYPYKGKLPTQRHYVNLMIDGFYAKEEGQVTDSRRLTLKQELVIMLAPNQDLFQ